MLLPWWMPKTKIKKAYLNGSRNDADGRLSALAALVCVGGVPLQQICIINNYVMKYQAQKIPPTCTRRCTMRNKTNKNRNLPFRPSQTTQNYYP